MQYWHSACALEGKKIVDLLEMIVCVAIDICCQLGQGAWTDLRISVFRRILWDLEVLPADRQSTRAHIKDAAAVVTASDSLARGCCAATGQ